MVRGPERLDPVQARLILQASLRQELRGGRGTSGLRGRLRGLFTTFLSYLMGGLLTGVALFSGAPPFGAAVFASSVLMLLVATFVVVDFSTIVTGPEDLAFYGALPVSPRTYVAAKLALLCLFALASSVVFALPLLVLGGLRGVPVGSLAAMVYALLASSVTAALAVAALLGLAVRVVPYQRVRTAAWFVQLVLFLALYAGFALLQRTLRSSAGALSIRLSWPLLLAPSAWGPALLEVGARGGAAASLAAPAGVLLSLAGPFLLLLAAWRVIAASYGGRIAEVATLTPRPKARARWRRPSSLWRTPEERAVALLIGNQFRHNAQFRFSILVIVPITVLYAAIVLLVNRTPIVDPFTAGGRQSFGSTILLYVAVGFFPSYLKSALTSSSEAEASWILHASPADRLLLLRAARRFILAFFLLPYLAALWAVFALLSGVLFDTLRHFLAVGALVLLETDVLLLFFPQLPFSLKQRTGQRGAAMLLRLFGGLLILPPLYLLVVFVYPHPVLAWAALAGLGACVLAVRLGGERFAGSRLRRQEFLL
jgi:hypothetical protein